MGLFPGVDFEVAENFVLCFLTQVFVEYKTLKNWFDRRKVSSIIKDRNLNFRGDSLNSLTKKIHRTPKGRQSHLWRVLTSQDLGNLAL